MSQSPRTPTIPSSFLMAHKIHHRFSGKQLLVSIACGYCDRVMLFGLKCKECGYVCVTLTLDRRMGWNSMTTTIPENILLLLKTFFGSHFIFFVTIKISITHLSTTFHGHNYLTQVQKLLIDILLNHVRIRESHILKHGMALFLLLEHLGLNLFQI